MDEHDEVRAYEEIEEAAANVRREEAGELLDKLQHRVIPSLDEGLAILSAIKQERELTAKERRQEREFTLALQEAEEMLSHLRRDTR